MMKSDTKKQSEIRKMVLEMMANMFLQLHV